MPPSIENIPSILYHYSKSKGHKCCFIQIGAYDGITNDLIYSCVKEFDWYGALVEPISENFNQLMLTYKDKSEKLEFINAAIGGINGFSEIYTIDRNNEIKLPEWCYQISSLDYKTISSHIRYEPKIESLISSKLVQVITFSTLIKQLNISNVDILIIDTEGYDYQILKSIDWTDIRPDIIIFEFVHMRLHELKSLLKDLGLLDYNCYLSTENCLCVNAKVNGLHKQIEQRPFYYKSRLKIT